MTQLKIPDLLLANLQQQMRPGQFGYMTREEAYDALKEDTGKDFGYDAKAWAKWLRKYGKKLYK